jgi:hypothetical protein
MDEKEKADEQKPLTFRRTIEQVVEFPQGIVNLENIAIAGKSYNLEIVNKNDRFSLNFNNGDFQIIINEDGIRFNRTVYRPNHDHNDEEYLQVGVDDKIPGVKKGELQWLNQFPYKKEGKDFFKVEFGARRVEY